MRSSLKTAYASEANLYDFRNVRRRRAQLEDVRPAYFLISTNLKALTERRVERIRMSLKASNANARMETMKGVVTFRR